MDIQDQVNNDDQELAMALASISQNGNQSEQQTVSIEPQPEEQPAPAETQMPEYIATPAPTAESPQIDSRSLEDVRKDALSELRPLVDKLDMSPEDKFDICLMLLRSTDDKTLIPAAHEAAKNIADETKRAQALLDVIREIDFLSTPEVSQS
jgi:hypothetical protein